MKRRLDAGESLQLLDVREPWEYSLARIEGSELAPLGYVMEGRLPELDPERETVVICHHGLRSAHAARVLQQVGLDNVLNLEGGLDAYSRVDSAVPRY